MAPIQRSGMFALEPGSGNSCALQEPQPGFFQNIIVYAEEFLNRCYVRVGNTSLEPSPGAVDRSRHGGVRVTRRCRADGG